MRAVASLALLAGLCTASPALAQPARFADVAHHGLRVDGVRFHYVAAGSGEPVPLPPGWPESWIALAHAELDPGDVRRLVLTKSALPGISPPPPPGIPSAAANLKSWQFAFNRLDDLPDLRT